jgi:hypothetical protein
VRRRPTGPSSVNRLSLLKIPFARGLILRRAEKHGAVDRTAAPCCSHGATNKVVHTIGNIESPEVVRFSPDGRLLYILIQPWDITGSSPGRRR